MAHILGQIDVLKIKAVQFCSWTWSVCDVTQFCLHYTEDSFPLFSLDKKKMENILQNKTFTLLVKYPNGDPKPSKKHVENKINIQVNIINNA